MIDIIQILLTGLFWFLVSLFIGLYGLLVIDLIFFKNPFNGE